jgi:hypothetical protein
MRAGRCGPVGGGGRGPQGIVDLVFADLPQQGARADAQKLGGSLPAARRVDQALLNRLALEQGGRWMLKALSR